MTWCKVLGFCSTTATFSPLYTVSCIIHHMSNEFSKDCIQTLHKQRVPTSCIHRTVHSKPHLVNSHILIIMSSRREIHDIKPSWFATFARGCEEPWPFMGTFLFSMKMQMGRFLNFSMDARTLKHRCVLFKITKLPWCIVKAGILIPSTRWLNTLWKCRIYHEWQSHLSSPAVRKKHSSLECVPRGMIQGM